MEIYLQGLLMGLAYVAPIGLQNLFVINTALTQSGARLWFTTAAVIFFDITLALACFFGIGAVMQQSKWLEQLILLAGSIVLIYIGIDLLRSRVKEIAAVRIKLPLLKVISSACVVTWFNPQALIDGSVMLGAFRAALAPEAATFFVGGFVSASLLWFTALTMAIVCCRSGFSAGTLRIINLLCGAVIICYGFKLLWVFLDTVF